MQEEELVMDPILGTSYRGYQGCSEFLAAMACVMSGQYLFILPLFIVCVGVVG